jgi:excisionase family DNA binding protein
MDSNGHVIAPKPDATVEDVAQHFGVSERTVRRWLNLEDAPPHRRIGNIIRFDIAEVDEWAKARVA